MTEFKVGDRVRTSTGWDGEVRFVEEYFATVRVRMSNGSWWYSTRSIDRLTLIPDTVTIEVSREDAELIADFTELDYPSLTRVALAARKALEANRD